MKNDDKEHLSPPAQASREGLRELEEGRKHHGTTAHTPAPHPNGAKFDEAATEVHRGGVISPNEK